MGKNAKKNDRQSRNAKVIALHPGRPVELTPQEVLQKLRDGNARYVRQERSVAALQSSLGRKQLAEQGQFPMAMVLGCADSRMTAEGIFDCGFGDLFVVRNFGGAVDQEVVGTLEYGHKHLKIPLLVILGHTGCSAVRSAIEVQQGRPATGLPPHAVALASRLESKVSEAFQSLQSSKITKDDCTQNERVFQQVILENLVVARDEIQKRSRYLSAEMAAGRLGLAMGLLDLDSGEIVLSQLQAVGAQRGAVESSKVTEDSATQRPSTDRSARRAA